jgi:hypothetical protein
MLSDVLIPMLNLNGAADPIGDYLTALRLLEGVAGDVDVLVPGHGSAGRADQVCARIDQDRAYVHAVRDGDVLSDPRTGPLATYDWVAGLHERQLQSLAQAAAATGHRASSVRRQPSDGWPGRVRRRLDPMRHMSPAVPIKGQDRA